MGELAVVRFMQGSEAVAEGAMAAGLRFYGGYPITPSTEIAEILSRRLPQVGGVFIQMEDEIASIASVIGASIAGLKAATATSGPGFSLMQENLGFAVAAEVPCVIVNVQRTGPSTGQPTAPAQGDVMQARWGTHGDHPIIALSASSVRECFDQTIRAFNLAEKYRTPVILLLDEVVAHMRERTVLPPLAEVEVLERPKPAVPPEWYFPYEEMDSDVPPLAAFGEGYRYHVTGLFHDRAGFPTLRSDEINAWLDRVFRKIELNTADIVKTQAEFMDDARMVVIAYGSTARAARQAVREARSHGRRVGLLKLLTIWPFAEEAVEQAAHAARRLVVPEMNRGQLLLEVQRAAKGHAEVVGVNRADGGVITPQQILQALEVH
ncbi:MAG: 2-oxoacid:acceptor oxidoreductase subunit alpha [Dehalococcoidales bacterium]|nr:2-oxoacid:acceptor oxidoreductase subunit alpha [Dehalococcoidales bacterium]